MADLSWGLLLQLATPAALSGKTLVIAMLPFAKVHDCFTVTLH